MRHCFVPTLVLAVALGGCKGTTAKKDTGTHAAEATAAAMNYDRPGYVTAVVNNRLWVFQAGSKEYADFQKHGEPTISSVKIGVGPGGMTVKAPDMATIDGWLAAK